MKLLEPLKEYTIEDIKGIAKNTDIFIFNQGHVSATVYLGKLLDKNEMGEMNFDSYAAALNYVVFINKKLDIKPVNTCEFEYINSIIKTINTEVRKSLNAKQKINPVTILEKIGSNQTDIKDHELTNIYNIVSGYEIEHGLYTPDDNRYMYAETTKIPNLVSAQAIKILEEYKDIKVKKL